MEKLCISLVIVQPEPGAVEITVVKVLKLSQLW